MDKEKVLYWYYTVKDTFTSDQIKNDQDLKEKYVSIEIYLLKKYGKIDDLSLSEAVELKLKVPKKHYGLDYKDFIEKLDFDLFKRLYDEKTKKDFDYNKLKELRGLKVEFFSPNEKEIGELYRIYTDGEKQGIREANQRTKTGGGEGGGKI